MANTSNYDRYANEILNDVETYKLVLNGSIKRFPPYFWEKPYSLQSSAIITRYLIEERLKIKVEDIPKVINAELFRDNKLKGMSNMFNGRPQDIIENAYPNRFKPWEFKNVPNGFWNNKDNIAKAVKWLIEDKLRLSDDEVKKLWGTNLLRENGLEKLCKKGIYNLLNIAYPGKYKPWELNSVSPTFWNDTDNIKKVVKWLIEDKLKWNDEQVRKYYNQDILNKNGLMTICSMGVYETLNIAYPNKYKPWELTSHMPNNFWDNKENIKGAIKWVVETKIKPKNKEDILKGFTHKALRDNGLSYLTRLGLYNCINTAYPGLFKPEDFKVGRK